MKSKESAQRFLDMFENSKRRARTASQADHQSVQTKSGYQCRNCGEFGHNSRGCDQPKAPPKMCEDCGQVFGDQYRKERRKDRAVCVPCARIRDRRQPRACTACGVEFLPNRWDRRTCSEGCRRKAVSKAQAGFESMVGMRFGKWIVRQHDKANECVVECGCGHLNVRDVQALRDGKTMQCRHCRRLEVERTAASEEACVKREAYLNAQRERNEGTEHSLRVFKRGAEWRSLRAQERRAAVDEIKSAPCMDCGGTFPPVCMDFDHRPGEVKSAGVSQLKKSASMEALLAEIAKCDLVCANCHRIRTYSRGDTQGGYGWVGEDPEVGPLRDIN
jgi:hypothetical protein